MRLYWRSASHFNPRSREGSDLWTKKMVGNAVVFQSTLP